MNGAGLHGLSEHFQYLAIKLWKLIEKEHTVMRLADFAGTRLAATSYQCGGGCTMMGRAKRAQWPACKGP